MSYNTLNYTEQGGEKEKPLLAANSRRRSYRCRCESRGITGVPKPPTSKHNRPAIKQPCKGRGDTVEVKIDTTSSKLYAPNISQGRTCGRSRGEAP